MSGRPTRRGRGVLCRSWQHGGVLLVALLLALALPAGADERATVTAIQQALAAMGYDPGTADGIAGRGTERAIAAFRREFGYEGSGEADEALLARIAAAAAGDDPSPERRLARQGLLRSYVRAVQEGLAALGYDPGPVDGIVGPLTRAAIRAFQTDRSQAATGAIAEALLAAINRARGL